MKFSLTINEKDQIIEAEPSEMLLGVLRRNTFFSAKKGCEIGKCGACTVLLDDKPVTSCKIPVGVCNNSKIVTLDFFMKQPVYAEISKGFEMAGVSLCGFCNAGKIFAAYEIITTFQNPTRQQIQDVIIQLKDCCVEKDSLINAIVYAAQIHFEKEKKRRNAK